MRRNVSAAAFALRASAQAKLLRLRRFPFIIPGMTIDEQLAYLTRGCVDVVRPNELRAKLERAGRRPAGRSS